MGFYYGPGSSGPEEKPGSWKETLVIIWTVFRVLSVPLAVLFGAVAYLVLVFWLFTLHYLAGLAALLVVVLLVVARGVWEARHPPQLK